jgi:RNA polymerase sigma factor (sigma-70 family)
MAQVDDHVLWKRSRLGDTEAFGSLFERHARSIHAYCFRRTGDWAFAEDLTSITFLVAWRRRNVDLLPGKVMPWLFGIATNVLRGQQRALRRYAAALQRLPRAELERDFAGEVVERVDAELEMRAVLDVIQDLPTREQEVLALSVWQGLSQMETAYALDVPPATVRTRLLRARTHLRERLGERRFAGIDLATDEMESQHASADA